MRFPVLVAAGLDESEVKDLSEERIRLEVNEKSRTEDVADKVDLRHIGPRAKGEGLTLDRQLLGDHLSSL